ncbi:venom serine protease Bi-VSP-like [Ctenocephalides felis]|uniref:venom serine protease Bi-VSP-like n=1 Tax=Ctenocephalides felis TaxID=7515 RepID=UPI000E6E4A54|nr:venom serine protease Bi-VSP-like [Ctenocephalides felis]
MCEIVQKTILGVAIIFLIVIGEIAGQDFEECLQQCKTPQNFLGACISIRSCDSLMKLLPTSRKDENILNYLKQSACGFDQLGPKVCCPVGHSPFDEPNPEKNEKIENRFELPSGELQQCGNRSRNLRDHGGFAFIGGITSKQGEWPWVAALGYRGENGSTKWLCGGALITRRHVLTAAHCIIDERTICAGYPLGEKDVCSGDSGGPLMLKKTDISTGDAVITYHIVGVVAYGFRCAEPGYPGVYTRVTSFLPWIRANIS